MKRLLFSCSLFLSVILTSNAQSTVFTSVYYPNINKAELAIIQQDYRLALTHYKSAFESVKSGFARDYRNAILCAIQTKDNAFAFAYLEKVIMKRMDRSFFADTAFAPLMEKKAWRELMNSYDALYAKSAEGISSKLLQELIHMEERDQFFRVQEGSYEVFGDTIAKIDVENVTRFQQLVNIYGFPSEDLIGAYMFEQNAPYNIILHHQAQTLSNTMYKYPTGESLAPIIEQAAQAGKCSPAHAGYLLSMQNDRLYNYNAFGILQLSVNGVIRPYYLLDKIPVEKLSEINIKRASIGLESVDEFRKKCQFRLDNPNTPFKLSSHQNLNIWEMDEMMANDFEPDFDKVVPTLQK